jgi:hypothetical protein
MTEETAQITAKLVPEHERLDFLPRKVPGRYLEFEFTVYGNMDRIAEAYGGGMWDFFELSDGGFYIAPSGDGKYEVVVETNGYSGSMSHEAAGIVASLFALNSLCWRYEDSRYIKLFHQLRDYACEHVEANEILGAID